MLCFPPSHTLAFTFSSCNSRIFAKRKEGEKITHIIRALGIHHQLLRAVQHRERKLPLLPLLKALILRPVFPSLSIISFSILPRPHLTQLPEIGERLTHCRSASSSHPHPRHHQDPHHHRHRLHHHPHPRGRGLWCRGPCRGTAGRASWPSRTTSAAAKRAAWTRSRARRRQRRGSAWGARSLVLTTCFAPFLCVILV